MSWADTRVAADNAKRILILRAKRGGVDGKKLSILDDSWSVG